MSSWDKDTVKAAVSLSQVFADLTGQELRKRGQESTGVCPFHDDHAPSADINDEKNGGVWICRSCGAGGDVIAFVTQLNGITFPEAVNFLGERYHVEPTLDTRPSVQAMPTGEWVYQDIDGQPAYQVQRFDPPNKPKTFRQRRANGSEWIGGVGAMQGVPRWAYRVFDLKERQVKTAYIVEGEKKAEALWRIGIPATTCPGGAGKWTAKGAPIALGSYEEQLRQAGVENVVVMPDNDEPGRQHADSVARARQIAGLRVKLVELPDLPLKGDIVDYLALGHTRDDLSACVTDTAVYQPKRPSAGTASEVFALTSLRDLLAEPDEDVAWLVADRIPAGGLVLLVGKPKAGKSTMARDLAFAVARGEAWLGFDTEPGTVWYLALEDKRSEVRRHFKEMGATGEEPVAVFTGRTTEELLAQLQEAAMERHPALIIVDTMQRLIQAHDLNDYAEVTRKLTPVLNLAREAGAAVLLLHHAGKSERSDLDSVLGSTALAGSVDNILVLRRSDRYRTLASIQRVGPDLAQTVVSLDEGTGRVEAGQTREEADQQEIETALLEALRGAKEALTRAEWLGLVEGRNQAKLAAFRAVVDREPLSVTGDGVRGNPRRYAVLDSGTPVPAIGGEPAEPESSRQQTNGFASESAVSHQNSGTPVPGPIREPREPESDPREVLDL